MNWRQLYEVNKSMLNSQVSTNDAIKLSKWAIQSVLGGVKYMRIGYLARKKIDDHHKHDVIGVSRITTRELQSMVNLNINYAWGVLKTIVHTIAEQPDGSYYLVKDPNRFIIRLYKKIKLAEDELQ